MTAPADKTPKNLAEQHLAFEVHMSESMDSFYVYATWVHARNVILHPDDGPLQTGGWDGFGSGPTINAAIKAALADLDAQ
jgi:hypothetical protein